VNLTLAVAAINSWNRLNVSFRTEAGKYQPARQGG
jgi:alkylhydroperoxidase family enzyme